MSDTPNTNTIHVWNKGRRTWDLKGADGKMHRVAPQESLEMTEVEGLRKIAAYHKDFTASKGAGPSTEDLKRREQSLRDREAALKVKEEALEARIQKVREREDAVRAGAPIPQEPHIDPPAAPVEPSAPSTDADKAELIAEAKALGLKVDGRLGADKIAAMIYEAKAAK